MLKLKSKNGDIEYRLYENNDESSEGKGNVRIAFPELNVVIKLFDPDQGELWTLKFWAGSNLDKIASYWNTKPLDRELTNEERGLVVEAFTTIRSLSLPEFSTHVDPRCAREPDDGKNPKGVVQIESL